MPVSAPDFRILFESAPGLYLVLSPEFRIVAVSDAQPLIASVAAPRTTGTILLVEDQAPVRMLAEDVLCEAGHRVLSAGNGAEALKMAESWEGEIDLLITDVVMPEMSGPQLATRVTRTRPSIVVLYVSGYTDHALLHRGVFEVGTAFLSKPFAPEALVQRVGELLQARQDAARASGAAM